jgi:hypothetical protein
MSPICIIAGTALSGFRCALEIGTHPWHTNVRCLFQAPEFLWGDAKLFQYFVVQRRSNFAPAVYGNCHGAAVRMSPALVTARLAHLLKTESYRHPAELFRPRALGMHDFSRVRRHWRVFVAVLGCNHRKHLFQFEQRHCSGGHQCIAARNRWDLCNPA